MNDFEELERELRKLRPVPPSPQLCARIEKALEDCRAGAPPGRHAKWQPERSPYTWLSSGLGLAAAALLLFVLVKPEQPAGKNPTIASLTPAPEGPSINARFVPAGLTRVVYNTHDEGLFFPPGSDEPMRRVRSQKRETLQWRNATTGASLSVSYPSEEIFLIPVSGQ